MRRLERFRDLCRLPGDHGRYGGDWRRFTADFEPPADRTFASQVFMNGEPQLADPDDDGELSSTRIGPRGFVLLSTTTSCVPG